MRQMPILARTYIALVAFLGFSSLAGGFWFWRSENPLRFLVYLAIALLCSGLKVTLPGIEGNMSVNYLVFLAGFIQLSLPETQALGLVSCFMQSFWHAKARPRPVQVVFNVASIALAISSGYGV